MVTCYDKIPAERIAQFTRVLGQCKGYYLSNPVDLENGEIAVHYQIDSDGDWVEIQKWRKLMKEGVVEKIRPKNKIKTFFKNLFKK